VAIIAGSLAAWAAAVLAVLAGSAFPLAGTSGPSCGFGLAGGLLGVVFLRRWSVTPPIRQFDVPDIQVAPDSPIQSGRTA
jgi:hypothetical protein